MDTPLVVLLGIVVVLLLAGIWAYVRATKSDRVKPNFVREMLPPLKSGEPRKTQRASQYRQKWTVGERDFLDDPKVAGEKADQLLHEIMKKRGYPVTKIW